MKNIVYFDLETQKSADEVGGWNNKKDMGMSVAVTFSTAENAYHIYDERHVEDLIKALFRADLVVGFNVRANPKAIALAADVALLADWLRRDILSLAGPDYASRRALYVAVTRASHQLILSTVGAWTEILHR